MQTADIYTNREQYLEKYVVVEDFLLCTELNNYIHIHTRTHMCTHEQYLEKARGVEDLCGTSATDVI